MRTGEVTIPDDHAYLLILGDMHVGDKAFGKESRNKLYNYLSWVEDNKNARIILNGDLLNTATRSSKTSPFEQDMTLEEQINTVARLLEPVKDRIIGAVMGNHERRIADFSGYDPTLSVLSLLQLPISQIYFKNCGVLKIKVGKRNRGNGKEGTGVAYTVVFHHTTGGGKLIGSKLNRIDQMRHSTVTNADVYIGSHNHSLSYAPVISMEYNPYSETLEQRKQTLVSAGGYLEWKDSYAEAMQLEPMQIGSPRIRLDGKVKDVVVSL